MPIYEYACKKCSHTLDALQKMSDDPLVECPACGEPALKKLISAPRFRLKGDGWYETDFKKDNQRNLAQGDTEKSTSDDGKTSKSGSENGKKSAESESSAKSAGADKTSSKTTATKTSSKSADA